VDPEAIADIPEWKVFNGGSDTTANGWLQQKGKHYHIYLSSSEWKFLKSVEFQRTKHMIHRQSAVRTSPGGITSKQTSCDQP
jgi:hypothetical protein